MKLLTGQENVETWSANIWDIILRDVRIVVSTYQVLLDALCHSFVKMERLALIVFDEGGEKSPFVFEMIVQLLTSWQHTIALESTLAVRP